MLCGSRSFETTWPSKMMQRNPSKIKKENVDENLEKDQESKKQIRTGIGQEKEQESKIEIRKYFHAWGVSIFIIGVVISNSLVEYAIVGNLMGILTVEFGFRLALAAAIINIKEGLTSFMAIMGSFISDAYVSRYLVVLVSVALYIYGLILIMLSIRHAHVLLGPALVLIAMGEGSQEYTLRKFGADQFEEHIKEKNKAKLHSMAWWYTGSLVGSVGGMFVGTFLIRTSLAILVTLIMVAAFLVLVLGTLSYYRDVPGGSPFTHMLRVVVAAAKKRRLDWPADDSQIQGGRNHGGIASGTSGNINMSDGGENHNLYLEDGSSAPNYTIDETHLLPHPNWLRCLDKATINTKPEASEESKRSLCTHTEVQETKFFLRLFPVWATFLMYGMVLSMGKTFFIAQASTLDAKFNNRFPIPVTFLLAVGGFSKLLITKACLPLLNRLIQLDHGIPPKIRIGAGLFLSAFCCLTASLVETKRLNDLEGAEENIVSSMSILWLIPQFWLLGAMEGLVGDGIEDLFVSQVPKTIRKCGPAFSNSVEGMGSILSSITIGLTALLSQVGGGYSWFWTYNQRGRLHWYYLMFGGLSIINLCLYAFAAKPYLWQGIENRQGAPNRGTVKRAVACAEMFTEIFSMGRG